MSIHVYLRGVLEDDPVELDGEGERVVTFRFADRQLGSHRGQLLELDEAGCLDVIVRTPVAERVLADLHAGDRILASGLLAVTVPLGDHDDRGLVSVAVEAYSIGRDLAASVR